ncbi:MAG: magnesium transporter [Syntrophomonadaceae bacterium]|nr:magnesium transporter [Syntrophomonadaceae bacterium]
MASVTDMLNTKDYKLLKETLSDLFPMDIAEMLEDMSQEEVVLLFRILPKDQAAEVFSYLSSNRRKYVVLAIHGSLLNHIFDELFFDDKIDFLEEMPSNVVKSLLASSLPEDRNLINQFLNYPDNSAGSLMTIEYVDLKKNMTAKQAMDRIKKIGLDKETIYTCYVLDDTRRLEGIISLKVLVLAQDEQIIGDIMDTNVILAEAYDDQEEVAEQFMKYDLIAIPVVDGEKRLIGIITIDDIMDVIEQENTEDFQKMAAISPSDEKYLETGVFTMAKNRIIWLLVLMISATVTGSIITHFEALLSSAVVLAAFIPMLMNSGGNAGSQSATMVIRGMALGEIELSNFTSIIWKELRIGFLAGFILAAVNYIRLSLLDNTDNSIIITVSVTLILAVISAKILGGMLPMAAKIFKLDPAIMAGPLISTILDALTLIIYFGIANVLLF